jgi:hypothetical protein
MVNGYVAMISEMAWLSYVVERPASGFDDQGMVFMNRE